MDIDDKLDNLTNAQLRTVIKWTLADTYNAANNYSGLDNRVKGWCAMLNEAIEYQIDKAVNKNKREEE
jgi:hypothetical protein